MELLEAVRSALGQDLDERVIASALRDYQDTSSVIYEAFRSVPRTVLPQRTPGQLVVAQEMPDYTQDVPLDGTLNLLLFAHRVVVSDPFPQLEQLLHPFLWRDDSLLEEARRRLGIVLRWLGQIAPLADAGVVTICAGDGFPQPPPPPEDESVPDWMDREFLEMRLGAEYLNSFGHSAAEVRFWDQVLFSVRSGHRTDPVFDTPEAEQRFSALLEVALGAAPELNPAQRRLRVLLRTTQPDFQGLRVSDVAAVRESGAFDGWQQALSFAIEARAGAAPDLADAAFTRELEAGWQRLARGMAIDPRLRDLRTRAVEFSVNAAAAGAAFALGLATSHDAGFAVETGGIAAGAMQSWTAVQIIRAWLAGTCAMTPPCAVITGSTCAATNHPDRAGPVPGRSGQLIRARRPAARGPAPCLRPEPSARRTASLAPPGNSRPAVRLCRASRRPSKPRPGPARRAAAAAIMLETRRGTGPTRTRHRRPCSSATARSARATSPAASNRSAL